MTLVLPNLPAVEKQDPKLGELLQKLQAYVNRILIPTVPQPATTVPLVDSGSGAVGGSLLYARQDHVHPAASGGGGFPSVAGGKWLGYSTYGSQTGINNTGVTDVIVVVPFSLPAAATFSRIVVDVSGNDTAAGHKYDVGIYDKNGKLLANLGAITWTPVGAFDAPFLQGAVTFPPGEYFLAFTGTNGGAGATIGSIQVNQAAGLSFNYTTASTSSGGVLPSTIALVESAATSGFGNPPLQPVMILY